MARADPQRPGAAPPVLFLDVDGVLNVATAASSAFSALHASLLRRLARAARGARVVLSSAWRHDRQRLARLERAWRGLALPPIDGATPTLAAGADTAARLRVREIDAWLEAETARSGLRVARWAAVDDLDLRTAALAMCRGDAQRFVQTDPSRGLSPAAADALARLLGSEEREDSDDAVLTLSPETQLLRLALDLIVLVQHTSAIVVDTADFTVAAELDTSEQSLRAWLTQQEADFSIDRIATIAASPEHHSSETPFTIWWSELATLTPRDIVQGFTRSLVDPTHTQSSYIVARLVEGIRERDNALYCRDLAEAQFITAGLSTASKLSANVDLANSLLELLPLVNPPSPSRVGLVLEICQLFSKPRDRFLRQILVEYVARGELNSRAALDAVTLIHNASDSTSVDEIEELLTTA